MTEPKKPADRQAKTLTESEKRKAREAFAEQLAAGLDLSPLTVDMKDGHEWAFTPDLSPAQMTRLQDVASEMQRASADMTLMEAAFEDAAAALRELLIDPAQREAFPLPVHGIRAISFLLATVIRGKAGLPTSP